MGRLLENQYQPDVVTSPGETLADTIQALGMEQNDLAERIGLTPKTVNKIIKGGASITPDTALLLERALGVPATFWLNRQRRFDELQARSEERGRLQVSSDWVRQFPFSTMVKYGWVPAADTIIKRIEVILNYFGVVSPSVWESYWDTVEVSYRKSERFATNKYSLAAWLRRGEVIGQSIHCQPFDADKFKSSLFEIRSLTTLSASEFQPKLIDTCASCGVAVAFVKELPKTASGATRWLTSEKALIQLSLKYKTDDHLWFTFFHEAGHILRHQKKGIYLEWSRHQGQEEEEANRFATDVLIPPSSWKKFPSTGRITKSSICAFARVEKIAPGVVVGQLQHKGKLPRSHCNDLKGRLMWSCSAT